MFLFSLLLWREFDAFCCVVMEKEEVILTKDGGAAGSGGNNPKSHDAFIDRSKVRILLCDNDHKSSGEILTLLCECSYQVTSVKSARQVIDALNAVGPEIDIILAEVDLPMAKGMKMLKYIMRDKELHRIPVIMMSAQDEVSVVVKCLRLGAADYLVKPLRSNELLNIWTHMWRRRRMLGLMEKNTLIHDFDMVASDPSDANTTSTTLFSDDTDDKSRKSTNPEMCISTHQEDESNPPAPAADTQPTITNISEYRPDVPGISDRRTGQFSSCPKKTELKVGESSAFFTYVKSSMLKSSSRGISHADENATQNPRIEELHQEWDEQVGSDTNQTHEKGEAWENYSHGDDYPSSSSIPDSLTMERSSTPQNTFVFPQIQRKNSKEENFSHSHIFQQPDSHLDVSSFPSHPSYPYYMSGMMMNHQMNHQQIMMAPSSSMVPQYNNMTSYPYYPFGICLQPGQIPSTTQQWSSVGAPNLNSSEAVKSSKVDKREAALLKFRQKRKERCFDKKIRYVNRKKLAERRPRVRGQFVRKMNGINVDLNGPSSVDFEEDEEEEEEEDDEDIPSNDYIPDNSPSGFQCWSGIAKP